MARAAYRTRIRAAVAAMVVLALGGGGLRSLATAQEVPKEVLDAARKEGRVVVYGSIESEVMKAAQDAFEARYGIKAEYWRAASTKVMDRVLTESRAGKPLFDVVLTNATPMKILKQEGAFAPYVPPTAAALLERTRSRQGVPTSHAQSGVRGGYVPDGVLSPPYRMVPVGVLYNTRLVKAEEAPRTLKDLLDPKWKGKIVMPDPSRHSTTTTWLANLDKVLGKDSKAFVEGLARQRPILVESFIPSAKKVIAGEAPLGITYIKYVYIMGTKEGAPLDYARITPVLGDAHAIALGAKAQNPNAAKTFINFFISPGGLKLLASEGEFVLMKGIYPPIKEADQLEIIAMDDLTDDELRKRSQEFKQIFF